MNGSDPARTKRKGSDGEHVAGVDDNGSEVSRKRDGANFLVRMKRRPTGWIGEAAESALDLIRARDRLRPQIVPEEYYRVHVVVLSVEVEDLGRFAPINVCCNPPAPYLVKVKGGLRRPFGKVNDHAVRVHASMFIAVDMRREWNGGDGLIKR
jgi:hypothetical protein